MKKKEAGNKEMNKEESKKNTEAENNLNENLDEKDLQIQILEKEISDYKDKLLRKAAEFENYKRRTENDRLNLFHYGAENFIVKLLPVVDDFERSILHIEKLPAELSASNDLKSVKEGVKLIYEKLMKILDEQGVKKIEAAGKPFDVQFHEAVMQRTAEDVAPLTVLDELEKGYLFKDKVIRHSKVIVSEELSEEPVNTKNNFPGEAENI